MVRNKRASMAERLRNRCALFNLGGYCQRGASLSCLYPPLTRKNMAKKKFKHLYKVETNFRKQSRIYFVYAFSSSDAFDLVSKHLTSLYSVPFDRSDFTDTIIFSILNFIQ